MLPCVRFGIALCGVAFGLGMFWLIVLNVFTNGCPSINGRICNERGRCDLFGVCHCDSLFSGDACSNTGIFGYSITSNDVCNGNGDVMRHNAYVFPECLETTPTLLLGRSGGWATTKCVNRLKEARKRVYFYENANAHDIAGLPMCLCLPGFAGPGCADACPKSIDQEVCSGNGNMTVGLMRNGTVGLGCQCDSILPLGQALPFLNRAQRQDVVDRTEFYKDGLCAKLVQVDLGYSESAATRGKKTNNTFYVVVPSPPSVYTCKCDERHVGEVCEIGACPQTEDGVFCSGNGHKALGFGAEYNTTRAVSAFGERGTPICTVGKNGCCIENQGLCGIPELQCPSDRPYRCSTTAQCVGIPRTSRCDAGWQYGYWDDPTKSPRRSLIPGDNTLRSRLVAYFFRIKNGTLSFTYRGETHTAPEGKEFWSGTMNETVDRVVETAFSAAEAVVVQIQKEGSTIEFWPAPFTHGDTAFDSVVRLVSTYGKYAVIDVIGSRVEFGDYPYSLVLANLSSDAVLRPGGSVVNLETCLSDLTACAWSGDQTGDFSLCERNGRIGSVKGSNACEFPTRPFLKVYTVAYGKSRVPLWQWEGDAQWSMQPFVGSVQTQILNIQATGVWVGQMVTLDDTRVPCVCEPPVIPNVNASAWNTKWALEVTRPRATELSGYALAKVEVWGDARWIRGVLQTGGVRVVDEYGDSHTGVTTSKVVSKEEYTKGRPTPVDSVHPHRCPDGRGAKTLLHELLNVPASTNCTMDSIKTTCDNGCVCSSTKCTCPESESETPLLEFLAQKQGKCWVLRPANTNWTQVSTNATATCFLSSAFDVPLEFKSDSPVNSTSTYIKARFYDGAWFDVELEFGDYSVYPVIDDSTKPYDEWCVFGMTEPQAEFLPMGISAYRHPVADYELKGSENQESVGNVVWNDLSTWSTTDRGYLRVNFGVPVRVIGIYVVFETMGLWVDDEFGALNMTLTIQSGNEFSRDDFKTDWEWRADVVGNVVNNTDARFIPLDGVYQSLRIVSRFPMSIRRFIPVTDQMCDLGLLIPGDTYPEDVLIPSREGRRIDTNTTERCVSDDSCVLAGESAAGDGVCADYKYLTWGLTPTESFITTTNLTAADVVQLTQATDNYTSAVATCVGNCCAWGLVVPLAEFTCTNSTLTFDADLNVTLALTAFPPNYVLQRRVLTWGPNLVEGVNTCPNGTDYTDCGASTRLDRTNPGLRCEPSAFETAFATRNTSAREFQTSAELGDLLSMGIKLNFTASWVRDLHVLGRGPCGDCDGRTRCTDGTCVDYAAQCPIPYYVTPGDGCVRIDTNRKAYQCACAVGWSGFACDVSACTALDPNTGAGDPHSWCTCGGPNDRSYPKLKVKPPFLFKHKPEGYTRKDVLRMNRAKKRVSDADVGWVNVQATEKPFPVAIKRQFVRAGVTKYSNCDYYVRVPDGRLMNLEECVESRSPLPPFVVTKWKTWPFVNGTRGNVTYAWDGPWAETKYDDAPWRCGSICASDERECYRNHLVNPPCGGNGAECRADGSCVCASGKETFVLTDHLSLAVSIPYASTDGVSDPTDWAQPDPVWYSTAVCQARNCTAVDCSPPYGCFVGSLNLEFADRMIACDAASGHKGMCAPDAAACRRGAVSEPILCSGNGVLRKRDYRDEWYCECGSPRSVLIKDTSAVRETSELIPNGFGGPRCDQYYCQDAADNFWIQRTDPRTNLPFVGSDGVTLPYKWKGPCGAPVGPKPEEFGLWRQCCNEKRLDKCKKIPCLKGRADKKYMTCEEPQFCLDSTSTPLVYTCNGHGKALADGTCACDKSETEGFTYDLSIWSDKGCIKKSQCEVAQSSGTMCNKKRDCADFDAWSEIPYLPYFNQQWPQVAIQAGLPPTNKTFVDLVFRDDKLPRMRYIGSQIGQEIVDNEINAQGSTCIYPDDDPTHPKGMVPYVAGTKCTYGQGYDVPSLIIDTVFPSANTQRILTDGVFGDGSKRETTDFVRLTRLVTSGEDDAGVTLRMTFPQPTKIKSIRVHARKTSTADVVLQFLNADGMELCPRYTAPISNTDFRWLGDSQNVHYCVPEYTPFDVSKSFDYQLQYRTNCLPESTSTRCTQWQDATCANLGYEVNWPPLSKLLPGCGTTRCCRAIRPLVFDATQVLTVRIVESTQTQSVDMDEIQVYGTRPTVDTVPPMMAHEIAYRMYPLDTQCRDNKFMDFVFNGQSLTSHLARNWTGWGLSVQNTSPTPLSQLNYTQAQEACEAMGSVFATNLGGASLDVEAESLGKMCTEDTSGIPCLVNARDRNVAQHPIVKTSINPEVYDEFIVRSCATWGCWTPNPITALTYRDYVATPEVDVSGLQWRGTEWCADCVDWTEYLWRTNFEQARQKDLVMGTQLQVMKLWKSYSKEIVNKNVKGINQLETMFWELIQYINVNEPNPRDPDFWHITYKPVVKYGNEFTYKTLPQFRTDLAVVSNSLRSDPVRVWTNPQTCVVTVYSESMCGRFSCGIGLVPPVDGGAKRVFLISPENDYGWLDLDNVIGNGLTFGDCVSDTGLCSKRNLPIANNIRSFSIQGPCMISFGGTIEGSAYTYHVPTEKYDLIPRIHTYNIRDPKFTIHELPGTYTQMDPGRMWLDGCYAQFDTQPPFDWGLPYYGVDSGSRIGLDTYLIGGQGVPTGILQTRTQTSMRIYAKFNSRKIRTEVRTFDTEAGLNENDYSLGHQTHPFMCSRVVIVQEKRVFAGTRKPSTDVVDYSPTVPGRWKRTTQTHTRRTHSNEVRTIFTNRIGNYIKTDYTPIGFADFRESNPSIYEFTVDEMKTSNLVKGNETTLLHEFVPCSERGRDVIPCDQCPTPRLAAWEWNQQFMNPARVGFVASVSTVYRAPVLHVSWNSTRRPEVTTYEPLSSLKPTFPAAFARLSCSFNATNFNREINTLTNRIPAYYYDDCLTVNTIGDKLYRFEPVVCRKSVYRAVCLRDYKRYTVQSGCQCDVCGPDSRSVPVLANSTVFTLYPKANPALYPQEHAIKTAWQSGLLDTFFESQAVPVDAIAAYILSTNQSFIQAFPGFYKAFWAVKSTRDNYLTPGQVADTKSWIDFDFRRMFPHACGMVYSRFTGEGRPMCAKSADFCSRDTPFPTPLMPNADYPTDLKALPDTEDPRTTTECGRVVFPWSLLKPTEDEPPPPTDGKFLLLEYTDDDYITIKTTQAAAYVRNTFRDLDVIKPGSVLNGKLTCNVDCSVVVWIGSTNPSFLDSESRLDVGTVRAQAGVETTYQFTVSNDTDGRYRTMGWDVVNTPVNTILKLFPVLITDDDSIKACRSPKVASPLVEPPPNIDSPAPQHQCVFTDHVAQLLGVRDVGVCWCSPASPYGGPTCEWPATISKHGKRVCNSFDGVRKSKSKEIAPNGQIVTVNEYGVYQYYTDRVRFGCKPRSDVGSILKTRLTPFSVSDFRYVTKSLARPNEKEFVVRSKTEIEDLKFVHSVKSDFITDVCNAFSSNLPSFSTGDEISEYVAASTGDVFLDMNGTFTWSQRGEEMRYNSSLVLNLTDPCTTDLGVCRALNFNNYVFNATGSFLVDGKGVVGVLTSGTSQLLNATANTEILTHRASSPTAARSLTVQLVDCDLPSAIRVSVYDGVSAWIDCTETDVPTATSVCEMEFDVASIRITAESYDVSLSEVGVFWTQDEGRAFLFA